MLKNKLDACLLLLFLLFCETAIVSGSVAGPLLVHL